jgi:hypothetical protein
LPHKVSEPLLRPFVAMLNDMQRCCDNLLQDFPDHVILDEIVNIEVITRPHSYEVMTVE